MASTTPPPSSSPVSGTVTVPQLDSAARFALAIKLLQTKPPSLSISEYFALLRSNTAPGCRSLDSTSERRHIKACEFWRKRFEVEATRVVELQARVNELTEKFNALAETSKVNQQAQHSPEIVEQSPIEGPAKKKTKVTPKRADVGKDVKRKANPAGGQKKPQPQPRSKQQQISVAVIGKECFFDETFPPFPGALISDLVESIRILHFVREPHLVSKAITRCSQALQKTIRDFINGKLSGPVTSTYITRGVTTVQAKELQAIVNFSQTVEKSCDKILSALSLVCMQEVAAGEGGEMMVRNNEFITDGICAVIKNMVMILSSIQQNSKALLSANLFPSPPLSKENSPTKDIRLELTIIIIRQLNNLKPAIGYQRNIIEGTFYHLLEIIGGALLRSFINMGKDAEKEELLIKLAVEETSWYLLRILESVLPVVAHCSGGEAGIGKLGDKAKERLERALMKGLFGNEIKSEDSAIDNSGKQVDGGVEFWGNLEKSGSWGNQCIFNSPFSRELWELLGLDILAS